MVVFSGTKENQLIFPAKKKSKLIQIEIEINLG